MFSRALTKVLVGAAAVGAALTIGSALPAHADVPVGAGSASGFGQVAGGPSVINAPVDQLVGSIGAPLVNANIPCPAPWQQGGLLGARYNACNAAPVDQANW